MDSKTKQAIAEMLNPLSHDMAHLNPTVCSGFEGEGADRKSVETYICRVCGLEFDERDGAVHCPHDVDARIERSVDSLKGRIPVYFREASSFLFIESQTLVKCETEMGPIECTTAHKLTARERHLVRIACASAICLSEDNGPTEQSKEFRALKAQF